MLHLPKACLLKELFFPRTALLLRRLSTQKAAGQRSCLSSGLSVDFRFGDEGLGLIGFRSAANGV